MAGIPQQTPYGPGMNAPNLVPNPNAVMMQNGAVGMPHMAAGNNGIGECAVVCLLPGFCLLPSSVGLVAFIVLDGEACCDCLLALICVLDYGTRLRRFQISSLLRTILPFNIPIHDHH